MRGIVLAGGYGKRLFPLTKNKRKPFIKILGKELYNYTLTYLSNAGINDVIIVGREGDKFKFEKGLYSKIVYQKGNNEDDALRNVIKEVDESESPFILGFTGFIASPSNIVNLALKYHSDSSYPNTIVVTPIVSGLETYGTVTLSDDAAIDFKPKGSGRSGYVFTGILILNYDGLKNLVEKGFSLGLQALASSGKLGAYVWSGDWMEIGYPWDLLEAATILFGDRKYGETRISNDAEIASSAIIEGPVYVGRNVFIDEQAYIKGPVYIGDNSRIGYSSFIRPYTVIEENTIIGSRNEIKRSIVMERSFTGTGVIVADSIIGEGSTLFEYSILRSTFVEEMPPRIRDKVFYRKKKPKLGSIIGPRCVVGPFKIIEPGTVMDC